MVRRALLLPAILLAGCGGEDSPPAAPPPAEGATVVWAVGDAATSGEAPQRVARMIRGGRVDRFVYLGDVYERGTLREFRRWYEPLYGTLAKRTEPVIGNHEHARRKEGFLPYWRAKGRAVRRTWWARRLGEWDLVFLDSAAPHGPHAPQTRWLRRRIRRAGAGTCRVAFTHRPRLSAGQYGDQGDLTPFWDALRGSAIALVSGHEHNMQRLRPVDGIVQFVSGAGGRERYDVDEGDERVAFSSDTRYGALRFELGTALAWSFVADDGELLDAGELTCAA